MIQAAEVQHPVFSSQSFSILRKNRVRLAVRWPCDDTKDVSWEIGCFKKWVNSGRNKNNCEVQWISDSCVTWEPMQLRKLHDVAALDGSNYGHGPKQLWILLKPADEGPEEAE